VSLLICITTALPATLVECGGLGAGAGHRVRGSAEFRLEREDRGR
jgi:hypothetical protein